MYKKNAYTNIYVYIVYRYVYTIVYCLFGSPKSKFVKHFYDDCDGNLFYLPSISVALILFVDVDVVVLLVWDQAKDNLYAFR